MNIGRLHRMRQSTDRNAVDSRLGIIPDVLQSDSARGFQWNAAAAMNNSLPRLLRREVIQKDDIGFRMNRFIEVDRMSVTSTSIFMAGAQHCVALSASVSASD